MIVPGVVNSAGVDAGRQFVSRSAVTTTLASPKSITLG